MSRERLSILQQEIAAAREATRRLRSIFVDDDEVRDRYKALYRLWDDDVAPRVEDSSGRTLLDHTLWSLWEKSEQQRARKTACERALKQAEDQCKALVRTHRSSPRTRSAPPDFDAVIADSSVRENVKQRWKEVEICIEHGAHISAVVMLGSIVEAVLLSRSKANPQSANSAVATPKQLSKSGKLKPKPLSEWKFAELIDVAEEVGWLSRVQKDASHLLRDWRNLVHSNKQVESGLVVGERESSLLLLLCRELLK